LAKTSQTQDSDEEASDARLVENYDDYSVLSVVGFVLVVAGKEVVEVLVIEPAIQVVGQ